MTIPDTSTKAEALWQSLSPEDRRVFEDAETSRANSLTERQIATDFLSFLGTEIAAPVWEAYSAVTEAVLYEAAPDDERKRLHRVAIDALGHAFVRVIKGERGRPRHN